MPLEQSEAEKPASLHGLDELPLPPLLIQLPIIESKIITTITARQPAFILFSTCNPTTFPWRNVFYLIHLFQYTPVKGGCLDHF